MTAAALERRAGARSVLYVNPTSDRSPLLVELVRALHPTDFMFTVCALDRHRGALDDELGPLGLQVHRLAAENSHSAPVAALRLARLVRRVQPDVLHTNMFIPGLVGEVARNVPWPLGRPVPSVFTRHHDTSHHLAGKRLHVRLDALTATSAAVVVAPSEAVRRTLTVREGVPSEKVVVVPHGLDFTTMSPAPAAIERWQRKFGPGPLLVSAARLDPLKGLDTLFAAVAQVTAQYPDVQLAVAGAAVEGYEGVVREQAKAVGVDQRVHILGHVPDIHALIAAADVFVAASEAESFGLSILEAMALEVPLAVTTPGGVGDIVAPDYPALPPGDVTALAEAIAARLDDAEASMATALSAARRVRLAFSSARMATGYAAAYERALRGRITG